MKNSNINQVYIKKIDINEVGLIIIFNNFKIKIIELMIL